MGDFDGNKYSPEGTPPPGGDSPEKIRELWDQWALEEFGTRAPKLSDISEEHAKSWADRLIEYRLSNQEAPAPHDPESLETVLENLGDCITLLSHEIGVLQETLDEIARGTTPAPSDHRAMFDFCLDKDGLCSPQPDPEQGFWDSLKKQLEEPNNSEEEA